MLEQSSEVSGTQNHFESDPVKEMNAFKEWVEEFAVPILTALENRNTRVTLRDEVFLQLSESLNKMSSKGPVLNIYTLLKERIAFILMSESAAEDQKRELYKLLKREKLFNSPQGIEEYLRQQPH